MRAVKARGAEVILHGANFDESLAYALALRDEQGLTFVHPYDDDDVICGQGTVGSEILRQVPGQLDAIFVPVGGGGLAAGIAAYVKYVRPDVKVIAVEPEDAACLQAAQHAQERVILPQVGLFADGVAVKQIGEHTWNILRDHIDDVITCTTDEMCAAVKNVFEDTRVIAEPAGALSLAGLRKWVDAGNAGDVLLAINSGANMNFDRLRHVSERTELGEGREAILAITIPERPGSFRQFCAAIGQRNITEFNYRYADADQAHVFLGVHIAEPAERDALVTDLEAQEYAVHDLVDSEVAKLHVRHLVGGRAQRSELAFTIAFPERPGALGHFLTSLDTSWNITGFHYRNHGADYGRVLLMIEPGADSPAQVEATLQQIGYPYSNVSDDTAYRLFAG